MTTLEKLPKLMSRMQRLADYLHQRNDLVIHQHINQFFYMQKLEELQLLLLKHEELQQNLSVVSTGLENHYRLCFLQWRDDARWLRAHLCSRPKPVL